MGWQCLYEKDLPKSEFKTHVKGCHVCGKIRIDNFKIFEKFMSAHEDKIIEAFFIKKKIPSTVKHVRFM